MIGGCTLQTESQNFLDISLSKTLVLVRSRLSIDYSNLGFDLEPGVLLNLRFYKTYGFTKPRVLLNLGFY